MKKITGFICACIVFLTMTISGCTSVEKNPSGPMYFENLTVALKKEYNVLFKKGDNAVIFVLHSDTICSCNGKNVFLVDEIVSHQKNMKAIVILKNDYLHAIRDMIHVNNVAFYIDTTKLLEHDGSVFRFDKIFVVKDGKYDNMFDLEDKDVKKIKSYFEL